MSVAEEVLMNTHTLCFGAKNMKIILNHYPIVTIPEAVTPVFCKYYAQTFLYVYIYRLIFCVHFV